jgi:predicted MPP superfamily phosphohydrolase
MSGNIAERPVPLTKAILSRRHFLQASAAIVAGMGLYSYEIARHEISVVTQTVPIRNLPTAFQNFRVAQISDIHLEEFTEPYFLARVIDHVNALKPDITLLTGDFITQTMLGKKFIFNAVYKCLEMLRSIQSPRFACMGNHDSIIGAPILRPIFASYDTPLLMNENLPYDLKGDRVWICGVGDMLTEFPNLFLSVPAKPDAPVLLMCHEPDYADVVQLHPRGHLVDLMLSGHSHGGQVCFPIVGALHTPLGGHKYVQGMFNLGQMQLYVNRGIGTVGLPFRLNCPPEITLFTLQTA